MSAAPLLYLSAADVKAAMPPVEERLALARQTMVALVDSADLPPKLGVHPRQTAAHTAAMPALLRGPDAGGAADLLGVKWVTAFPGNRALGLDAVHALVALNDPTTGEPVAILDGGPITAQRTAAVSGVALREWWPRTNGPTSVALVGAGVQGKSHVAVLAHVAPRGTRLAIADRHPERAAKLGHVARDSGAFAEVTESSDVEATVSGAEVVLTMVSFGTDRQSVPAAVWQQAKLIVAVDYDMCLPGDVVSGSTTFLTDDITQFEATRTETVFAGYPRPDTSIGEALRNGLPALRGRGPIVVNHLGVGLADVVFADAIVKRAKQLGLGTELPR
jgi:ornithine cyclodeaminase/alanine dehydrogenase-like protein (mu-crystallin family)